MKRGILACVLLISLILPSSSLTAIPAKITITSTLVAIRENSGMNVRQYLLWNKQLTSVPIGHAFSSCANGPGTISICKSIYTLPYGRIIAIGEIHSFSGYYQIIVGGTQSERAVKDGQRGYPHASGILKTTRIGPGTYSLIFVLTSRS